MSFKKETEKILLLQMKGLIDILFKFKTKKNLHISIIHWSSFREEHH